MARWNWERLAAGSGILFVVLFVIGWFVPGKQPSLSASNAKWVHYFLSNSREIKVSAILFGLALIAFIWFGGSLAARLRDAGEARLGAIAFGGTVATAGVFATAIAIWTALAYRIAAEQPTIVKPFVDVGSLAQTVISFPVAIVIGATAIGIWRSGIAPKWWAQLDGLAALCVLVSGGALSHKGFYAPDGGFAIISLIVALAWTLLTSAWLASGINVEPAPKATAVPAA
jgi:hypothetical protein